MKKASDIKIVRNIKKHRIVRNYFVFTYYFYKKN